MTSKYTSFKLGADKSKQKKMVCAICGYAGVVEERNKGTIWFELLLWLFFIVPGIIYSFWRLTHKEIVCPKCDNVSSMIPVDSPRGRELVEKK